MTGAAYAVLRLSPMKATIKTRGDFSEDPDRPGTRGRWQATYEARSEEGARKDMAHDEAAPGGWRTNRGIRALARPCQPGRQRQAHSDLRHDAMASDAAAYARRGRSQVQISPHGHCQLHRSRRGSPRPWSSVGVWSRTAGIVPLAWRCSTRGNPRGSVVGETIQSAIATGIRTQVLDLHPFREAAAHPARISSQRLPATRFLGRDCRSGARLSPAVGRTRCCRTFGELSLPLARTPCGDDVEGR